MFIASLGVGILTGLVSATALLLTGHNIPDAILGYSLAGIAATLVVAMLTAVTRQADPTDY